MSVTLLELEGFDCLFGYTIKYKKVTDINVTAFCKSHLGLIYAKE